MLTCLAAQVDLLNLVLTNHEISGQLSETQDL
jgi:hypothetical protein